MTTHLTALIAQWRAPPVAPEPPAIGMKHMTEMSIRKARRDWWREGYAQACRDKADDLAAVVQAEATAPDPFAGLRTRLEEEAEQQEHHGSIRCAALLREAAAALDPARERKAASRCLVEPRLRKPGSCVYCGIETDDGLSCGSNNGMLHLMPRRPPGEDA